MFDQFKAMGQMASLLKDKDKLREMGEDFKQRLENITVTGAAGGGVCKVTVKGTMRVVSVEVDPSLATGMGADDNSRRMGEQLIEEATNDALERVQRIVAEQAQQFAQEMGLPDLPGGIGGSIGNLLGG